MTKFLNISAYRRFTLWNLNIFFLSLILRIITPPNILAVSPHDDLLEVQKAISIEHFQWLGPWDNRTLLKPPLYSIFISILHLIHIGPTIGIHILLLLAFLSISKSMIENVALSKKVGEKMRIFTFAFLAFNPALYSSDFSRIYRIALASLLSIVALYIVFRIRHQKFASKAGESLIPHGKLIISETFLGIVCGLMILTRDESFWLILPVLTSILLVRIRESYGRSKQKVLRLISKSIVEIMIILLAASGPVVAVSLENQNRYGYFGTNDLVQGSFAATVKLWESVQSDNPHLAAVPVDKSQREKVYAVSVAAKKLEFYLEGPPNTGWKIPNCQQTGNCAESGGAWFPFELRDAAMSAMNLKSEVQFQNFFSQIKNDIEEACRKHALKCGNSGLGVGIGPLKISEIPQISKYTWAFFSSFLNLNQASNFGYASNVGVSEEVINTWKVATGLTIKPSLHTTWVNKFDRSILMVLRYVYQGLISITICMFVFRILNRRFVYLRNQSENFVVLFSLSSIFLVSLIYGLISNSWGFIAYPWLYGMVAQPIFMVFIASELIVWAATWGLLFEGRLVKRHGR